MSYQVIARKYRPQRFADVVGQEHVTQTLANAIAQKRIAHAYLFCGPRGTGKTTIARIFAKCLNCTGGPKAEFPADDPRAQEIAEGRSLDVMEIDGASNNGVEQVRELRETCKFAPAVSPFKIYIIDEVHMLSVAAFNALLKTLEEPPAHVKFLFATTDPQKVLPTILSRCQRFDLRRIPSPLITKHLAWISQKENVQIDEPALYAIARGAEGGLRDAESTLDQLISFCGNKIEEAEVLSMFGLTSRRQLLALTGAIINGEADGALRELNDLAKNGKDLSRLVSELLNLFRNLLIFQVSKGDKSLIEVSEEEAATLAERADQISTDALTRIMEVLSDCESRLRDATSKKILIEVALFRAIQARNSVPIDTVLKRLQELRANGGAITGSGKLAATATPVAAPVVPRPSLKAAVAAASDEPSQMRETAPPVSAPPAPPAKLTTATPGVDLDALWDGLIQAVERASKFTRTHLTEAFPVSFERGVLVIGYDPEFEDTIQIVDNSKNRTLLQTKLAELGHRDAQVKFITKDAPVGRSRAPLASEPATGEPAAPASKEKVAPASLEDFKNDPLIKQALELFRGQIVDVRV